MSRHVVEDLRFTAGELTMIIDGKPYRFSLSAISARLAEATPAERADFLVSPSGYGIHWPRLDEDISIDALIRMVDAKKTATRGRSRAESRPTA